MRGDLLDDALGWLVIVWGSGALLTVVWCVAALVGPRVTARIADRVFDLPEVPRG